MAAECIVCKLVLSQKHLHNCEHCKQTFCFSHLMEHDKKIQETFNLIPAYLRKP